MELSKVKELAAAYQDYMVKMRREFHRHPELSGEEWHTRDILVRSIHPKCSIPSRHRCC